MLCIGYVFIFTLGSNFHVLAEYFYPSVFSSIRYRQLFTEAPKQLKSSSPQTNTMESHSDCMK